MSKVRHTPGPWSVNTDKRYEDGKPCCVWGPKGAGYGTVCDLSPHYPREFNEANAKLIAAAPDLLEACEAAYNILKYTPHNDLSPTFIVLGAAIAKAKGEEDEHSI